jgi:hypothetical protein
MTLHTEIIILVWNSSDDKQMHNPNMWSTWLNVKLNSAYDSYNSYIESSYIERCPCRYCKNKTGNDIEEPDTWACYKHHFAYKFKLTSTYCGGKIERTTVGIMADN